MDRVPFVNKDNSINDILYENYLYDCLLNAHKPVKFETFKKNANIHINELVDVTTSTIKLN